MKKNINVADKPIIENILSRKRKNRGDSHRLDFVAVLKEILTCANEFVPSESCSILLDDPLLKWNDDFTVGKLFFMACSGQGSGSLVGISIPDNIGIVGKTYRSGKPYKSENVDNDEVFFPTIDKKINYISRSIICAPIKIDDVTIGVIELINSKEKVKYDNKDLGLLEIFANYTSTLIKNVLYAKRFEELSKIDDLTGLYNDRHFYAVIKQEITNVMEKGVELSLIFFDLDHLKELNDTHGHLAGSTVLKEVAVIMDEVFLNQNFIKARYGGDEYVVLMPGVSLCEAAECAEKFRNAIEKNSFLKEKSFFGESPLNIKGSITCSVGVASFSNNVESNGNLEQMKNVLIKAADSAMYMAKRQGKNKVVVAESSISLASL